MTDVLRIKRRPSGGAAGAPAALANAEIAYNEVDNTLYYGAGGSAAGAASILPIAGPGAFLPLSGGQLSNTLTINAPANWTQYNYAQDLVLTSQGTTSGQAALTFASNSANSTYKNTNFSFIRYGNALYVSTIDATTLAETDLMYWGTTGISVFVPIVLAADPTTNLQAATKRYVDNAAPLGGPYLPLSGGSLSGPLTGPNAIFNGGPMWSGNNYSSAVVVQTNGRNPAIGIADSTGANYIALANGGGNFSVLAMPALSDTTSGPAVMFSVNRTGGAVVPGHLSVQTGIDTNSVVATNPQDTSGCITLWDSGTVGSTYGFSITGSTLNYNTVAGKHDFYSSTTLLLSMTNGGINASFPVVLPGDPTTALEATTKQYSDRNKTRNIVDMFSGAVTLTVDQSDYNYLYLYGTQTAAGTLTLPVATTVRLTWIINNSTTGGFPVTVQGASGGTITVPPGGSQAVWTDTGGIYPLYNAGQTRGAGDSSTFWATTEFVAGSFLPLSGTGSHQMSGGIDFGQRMASSPTDMSAHIALYTGWGGFNVTSGTLGIIAGNAVAMSFTTSANLYLPTYVNDDFYVSSGGSNQITVNSSGTQFNMRAWLAGDPTSALEAATKQYVDAHAGGIPDAPTDGAIYGRGGSTPAWTPVLPITGGTLSGGLTANGGIVSENAIAIQAAGQTSPSYRIYTTGNGTDGNTWDWFVSGTTLAFRLINDAYTSGATWLDVTRSGMGATVIDLYANNILLHGSVTGYGSIYASGGNGSGYAALNPGDANNPGYLAIYGPSGGRVGYVGFQAGANVLAMQTESAATGWAMNGNLTVGGTTTTNGLLDVAAGFIATGQATSTIWASQGAIIGWNYGAPGINGETDFVNSYGGGNGGFAFYNVQSNSSATPTLLAALNSAGTFAANRLGTQNGDTNAGAGNLTQITLGYQGGGYSHWIASRHDATGGITAGNAIDFYVSDGTGPGVYPTNATWGGSFTPRGLAIPPGSAANPSLNFANNKLTGTPGVGFYFYDTTKVAVTPGLFVYGTGNSPVEIQVPNGDVCEITYLVTGTRQWGAGVASDGNFHITDQNAPVDVLIGGAGGSLSLPVGASFGAGINFGNVVASGPTDVTKHIALYATSYGFAITGNTLNYNSGGVHDFYGGSTRLVEFNASGMILVGNGISYTGFAGSNYIGFEWTGSNIRMHVDGSDQGLIMNQASIAGIYAPLSNPHFSAGVFEHQVAIAAANLDLNTASVFTRTISAAVTFTVSNVPTIGTVASFILDLTNGGAATITWWANIRWAGGAAPTLTAAGRDILGFYSFDAGANWLGLLLGKGMA